MGDVHEMAEEMVLPDIAGGNGNYISDLCGRMAGLRKASADGEELVREPAAGPVLIRIYSALRQSLPHKYSNQSNPALSHCQIRNRRFPVPFWSFPNLITKHSVQFLFRKVCGSRGNSG